MSDGCHEILLYCLPTILLAGRRTFMLSCHRHVLTHFLLSRPTGSCPDGVLVCRLCSMMHILLASNPACSICPVHYYRGCEFQGRGRQEYAGGASGRLAA